MIIYLRLVRNAEGNVMNQILSIISDIRVVIGIAVVVLILAVWLIVEKVRTKKFRKELQDRFYLL